MGSGEPKVQLPAVFFISLTAGSKRDPKKGNRTSSHKQTECLKHKQGVILINFYK